MWNIQTFASKGATGSQLCLNVCVQNWRSMVIFQLQMSKMSEKISIKMGVKSTASLNMGPIFYFTTHITSGQKKWSFEQKTCFYCPELLSGSKRLHLLPGTSNVHIQACISSIFIIFFWNISKEWACFDFWYQKRCITHPNIEYFILSLFKVETQKLKKIVKNMFFFVMKSGEIK